MKSVVASMSAILVLGLASCGDGGSSASSDSNSSNGSSGASGSVPVASEAPEIDIPDEEPPTELVLNDLRAGDGERVTRGDDVTMLFIGKRWDGVTYANSWDFARPPTFKLGSRQFEPVGVAEGMVGMREGGRREITVPLDRIFFPDERHRRLHPLDTVIYVVDVLEVEHTTAKGEAERAKPAATERGAAARGAGKEPEVPVPSEIPDELVVRDVKEGNGPKAKPGNELTTEFAAAYVTGKPFESTWDSGRRPFTFTLGAEESSPGWERGLPGMRQGGRRVLIVPPAISSRFGPRPDSEPKDTLVYVIDLVAVR